MNYLYDDNDMILKDNMVSLFCCFFCSNIITKFEKFSGNKFPFVEETDQNLPKTLVGLK